MISFGIIFDHFGAEATQMLQMIGFGIILDHFGLDATQMLQMVSFGAVLDSLNIILDHFGPNAAQIQFKYHLGSFRAQGHPNAPNGQLKYHWGPFRTQPTHSEGLVDREKRLRHQVTVCRIPFGRGC